MRRIPSGAMQKFYKRLYDLWKRYPDRWVNEKGYADADYFQQKLARLLKDVSAALKGQPIPGTMHPYGRDRYDLRKPVEEYPEYAGRLPSGQDVYEEFEPLPRHLRMTPGRTHFAPATHPPLRSSAQSRSRSVRPSFLRRGKAFRSKTKRSR